MNGSMRPTKEQYRDSESGFWGSCHKSGLLPDWLIAETVGITPMEKNIPRSGKISYGLTSYGYDARCGYTFRVFMDAHCGIVDAKNFDPKSFVEIDVTPMTHDWRMAGSADIGSYWRCDNCGQICYDKEVFAQPCFTPPNFILIPPNSFALAETIETFKIPRDVLAVCVGKSTYARCGIIVNVTPLEPEWEGKVTVEISNTTPLPAKIYAGEGIMQILFLRAAAQCEVSYADKKGIYQNQKGLTLPKVRK